MQTHKVYEHIIPDIRDWPIYHLSQNRNAFIQEMREHSKTNVLHKYGDRLKHVLRRTAYQERQRIKNQPWKADPSSDRIFWKKVQDAVQALPDDPSDSTEALELLDKVINRYSEEIVGNFKIKTFKFARKFLTALFGRLLNASKGRFWGGRKRLQQKLIVNGEVERLRHLFKKGTVVAVPTHFSNLDSILIGYAIDEIIGIPAFTYGAGLNLYDSEIIGYFMNRLGAYRVDRRKKNPIYIETLKSMSGYSIQKGVNGLFFPGGTRSRTGKLETELKQGLLHSLIESQREIFQKGGDNRIIVVPFIFNYHFVLEAEHLINQHLNKMGQDKFIRVKDDFKSTRKLLKFIWRLFSQGSEIYLSVGRPTDVLGNYVDDEARSLDSKGNEIKLKDYFVDDNEVRFNQQREKVYTKQLSENIVKSFKRYNTVLSSHIVSYAAFKLLEHDKSDLDLFGILRQPEDDYVFDRQRLLRLIEHLAKKIKAMVEAKEVMSSHFIYESPEAILNEGLKQLGVFHANKPLVENHAKEVVSQNFKTLLYYHNRLSDYNLEHNIPWHSIDHDTD